MQTLSNAVELAAAPYQALLLATFLMFLRVAPALLFTPLLQAFGLPVIVRVLVVVGLAFALASNLDAGAVPPASEVLGQLIVSALQELALGATLALSVLVAFAAVSMAGRLCDVQIGFGMSQVFDPATRRQVPVLQAAFDRLGVILFFLVDGHHALLRGLAFSLERFPLGRSWRLDDLAPHLLKNVAALFGLGIALAAPVFVCLLLSELALGVISRALPQMNMFVMGVPMKIVVGLAVLSIWVVGAGDAFNRVYGSVFRTWNTIFAAPAAAVSR